MPSTRGMELLLARGIECKPLLVKPVMVNPRRDFPHICPGDGCAICAWVWRKIDGAAAVR